MTLRIKHLTLEQLNELIELFDKQIEGIKQLKALERQHTHAKHPDIRLTAVQNSLELQRSGYLARRMRIEIIGH